MKKHTIKDCQETAKLKNGLCLSTKYTNNKENLTWKCGDCNHIWEAMYGNIKKGQWCPKCDNKRRSNKLKHNIENIRKLIELKHGKLLSDKYINAHKKLNIQCEFGHIFKMRYNDIQQGSWCSGCADNQKLTIFDMQEIAKLRNGWCLSVEYIGAHSKLEWLCKSCHIFKKTYNKIQQGQWCPDCNIPLSELICKYIIEQIFYKPFTKIKPKFLKNSKTNRNLEIDLYNKELNIGLEHQGRHHYENNVYSNKNELSKIQERDQLKIELCKQNNTKLIIIPELFKQTKIEKLQEFIISECKKLNIQLPDNIPKIEIDINKIIRTWYNKT